MGDRITDVVYALAASLVNTPEELEIHEYEGERGRVIEVRTAPGEVGKLIGHEGRIAQAIRRVARSLGGPGHRWTRIEFRDGGRSEPEPGSGDFDLDGDADAEEDAR